MLYCRQQLGVWVPTGPGPRAAMARHVKDELSYQGWTIDDVAMTVGWCQRMSYHPRDMWSLLKLVDQAIPDTQGIDLQGKVAEVIQTEEDPTWVRRLSLAKGFALAIVYEEWRRAHA